MSTVLMTKVVTLFLALLCIYYAVMFFYYRHKYKNNKTAQKRTAFLVIPVVVLFLVIELGCRTLVANKMMKNQAHFMTRYCATAYYLKSLRQDDYKPRYIRLREKRPNEILVRRWTMPDIDNVYDCRMRTDSDGFILPECCGGNKLLVFLGGSTTECMVVNEKKRFPYLVARALQDKQILYTVKNAGVSGNNTIYNINTLVNKVLAYNPQVVVYMEAINDMTTLLYESSYNNFNPWRGLIVDENKKEEAAHDNDEFYAKRGYEKNTDTAKLLKQYKRALKMFVGMCRGADIQPVLMTQFNRIDSNNLATCRMLNTMLTKYAKEFPQLNVIALYRQMNETIRKVAAEENAVLIDLDVAVPKTSQYMYDIVHLEEAGSVLVAKIVSERLAQLLSDK